jgi:hypothetical protein
MPRKWIRLNINLLPIIINEVDKVTEIYLSKNIKFNIKIIYKSSIIKLKDLLNEMAFTNNDLFSEYIDMREDVNKYLIKKNI